MDLDWLTDLRRGPDRRTASQPIQLAYLVALVVGAVLFAIIAAPVARPLDGDARR